MPRNTMQMNKNFTSKILYTANSECAMAADNVNVIAFVRGLHNDAQGYTQTQRLDRLDVGSTFRAIFNEFDWTVSKMA
jgi:hypothetical protein